MRYCIGPLQSSWPNFASSCLRPTFIELIGMRIQKGMVLCVETPYTKSALGKMLKGMIVTRGGGNECLKTPRESNTS